MCHSEVGRPSQEFVSILTEAPNHFQDDLQLRFLILGTRKGMEIKGAMTEFALDKAPATTLSFRETCLKSVENYPINSM
jgi:hypothetical protein